MALAVCTTKSLPEKSKRKRKVCCSAFRKAVANAVGQEWGWIDGKSGTDRILHLVIPNEFDLWYHQLM
jgi:hypothetical protein